MACWFRTGFIRDKIDLLSEYLFAGESKSLFKSGIDINRRPLSGIDDNGVGEACNNNRFLSSLPAGFLRSIFFRPALFGPSHIIGLYPEPLKPIRQSELKGQYLHPGISGRDRRWPDL